VQRFAGHLADALRDGPSVQRLKRDGLQDQEVERALHEIRRFAHVLVSVTDNRSDEGTVASTGFLALNGGRLAKRNFVECADVRVIHSGYRAGLAFDTWLWAGQSYDWTWITRISGSNGCGGPDDGVVALSGLS
jgi:hypothetical protein